MPTSKRKGASRVADVPLDIVAGLNAGRIEAATLAENLATDFAALLSCILPELADKTRDIDPKAGITRRMDAAARIIAERYADEQLDFLASHQSDLVRGWGAYLLAQMPALPLAERITRMKPFADDPHFGVREWAWLALRPHIVENPSAAIRLLQPWVQDRSACIRRFAVEATRPRGVWSVHIAQLKSAPDSALPLLTPLRSDPSRYVQDSVANWLNDAWKSAPDWVEKLCREWAMGQPGKQTQYIIKRALRSQSK